MITKEYNVTELQATEGVGIHQNKGIGSQPKQDSRS
jgi:hypothetical protein